MPFYIPTWVDDPAAEIRLYGMHQAANNDLVGYEVELQQPAAGLVRTINDIKEGTAGNALYSPKVADVDNAQGTLQQTDNSVAYALDNDTQYVDWNVDRTYTHLTVVFTKTASNAGTFEVVKNPDTDNIVIVTIDTSDSTTLYRQEQIVDPVSFEAGDVIRFRPITGGTARCRVHGFILQSPGTYTSGAWALTNKFQINLVNSGHEFAIKIKPAGDPGEWDWYGSFAHQQGAGNCTEIDIVDTFTLDTVSWPVEEGFQTGVVKLVRNSNVQFRGATNLVSLIYSYDFQASKIEITHESKALEDTSVGVAYMAMLPLDTTFTAGVDQFGRLYELEPTGAEIDINTRDFSFGRTARTRLIKQSVGVGVDDYKRIFVDNRRKLYWEIESFNAAADDTWGLAYDIEFGISQVQVTPPADTYQSRRGGSFLIKKDQLPYCVKSESIKVPESFTYLTNIQDPTGVPLIDAGDGQLQLALASEEKSVVAIIVQGPTIVNYTGGDITGNEFMVLYANLAKATILLSRSGLAQLDINELTYSLDDLMKQFPYVRWLKEA